MKIHQTPSKTSGNAGNALLITLVAIVLLVALTMTITRMSSKADGDISAEQARIMAENIMRTAHGYEGAVQKLTSINQCGENDINFDNSVTGLAYTNAGAPSGGRCDLFNSAGAGLAYTLPDPDFLDSTFSAKAEYGEWVFTGSQCILDVGTGDTTCTNDSESELIAMLPFIREDICIALDNLVGVTLSAGAPPADTVSGTLFTGTFASSAVLGDIASSTAIERKTTGCIRADSGSWQDAYIFYHTLLIR